MKQRSNIVAIKRQELTPTELITGNKAVRVGFKNPGF